MSWFTERRSCDCNGCRRYPKHKIKWDNAWWLIISVYFLLILVIPAIAHAQYNISDMETVCAKEFNPQQVIDCTYAQRINFGLESMRQIPHLSKLHLHYRDNGEFKNSINVAHHIHWIISRNDFQGAAGFVEVLIQVPMNSGCLERDGWRYVKWSEDCPDLRFYIVDSFIIASEIAEAVEDWYSFGELASALSYLTIGVTGEPLFKIDIDYNRVLNMSIPTKYRPDLWERKSNRAKNRGVI